MVFDDEYSCIRLFDPHLAWRDENSEIRDCRLRPLLEPVRDRPLEFLVDGVVSTVFRGTRSADETILHPTDGELRESLFHLGAPIIVELRSRNFNCGHADSRIQRIQERVVELSLPGQLHRLLSDRSFLIDFQRHHWQLGRNYRFHWASPYLFLLNEAADRQESRLRCPPSACCRELESSSRVPGSESRHRVYCFSTLPWTCSPPARASTCR